MERDEILEKSRKENRLRDERDRLGIPFWIGMVMFRCMGRGDAFGCGV